MRADDGEQGTRITTIDAAEELPHKIEWVEIRGRNGYASVHIGMPKDSVKRI